MVARRTFLAGAAGTAAALALGGCSSPARTRPRPDPGARRRVVVVGAGLAGLTAAVDLLDAGWEVVVLEARDRVGGRVLTLRDPFPDGLHAEAGGESIDDGHHALQALLRRYDLRTERRPANREATGIAYYRGRRQALAAFAGRHDGAVLEEYDRFDAALARVAEDVDPEAPDRSPRAEELDARSVQDLLDELHLGPEAAFLVTSDNRSYAAAELADISLLFWAQQWQVVADVPYSAEETMRVAGGNSRLPEALAVTLGDALRLGRAVEAVEHGGDGVRVTVAGDDRPVDAAQLVLATPPLPLRRIRFDPALPASVATMVDGLDLGPAAKVISHYDEAFWREEGRSGLTVADLPFGVAWDATDSYATGGAGLLTAFVTGDAAVDLSGRGDAERIAEVQRQLDEVYPEGRPLRSAHSATLAWRNEPLTGGGYAVFRPGQLAPFWPALREPVGPIRFAGEHTEALAGYMESAVRSGHRVAAAIGRPPS